MREESAREGGGSVKETGAVFACDAGKESEGGMKGNLNGDKWRQGQHWERNWHDSIMDMGYI